MRRNRKWTALLGGLWLGASFNIALPASADDGCESGLVCPDQGWDKAQRNWWQSTSQGSRLLPLDWMLALERADAAAAAATEADKKFLSPQNMRRLGYLPGPQPANGLPLGFVVDHDPKRSADLMCDTFPATCDNLTMRKPWVGLNCSACHTNEIEFGGKRIRIDGAATMADFQSLEEDLLKALRATVAERDRFDRFARAVLGTDLTVDSREQLERQLAEQIAWQDKLEAKNAGAVRYGHGRLDAQGHILNKVALALGVNDQPAAIKADAPASYPFIWNASQQGKIQWNGIANNILKLSIFGNETDIGALVRNASEVIGVFAHVENNRGKAWRGYDSSVRVDSLIGLERVLSKLKSPRWPEKDENGDVLPALDWEKAARGKLHFDELKCASCHQPLAWDDLQSPANEKMDPIQDQGTDIFLACNAFMHMSKSGNLEGQKVFAFKGDRIGAVDVTRNLLINTVVGTVVGKLDELAGGVFGDVFASGAGRRDEFGLPGTTIDYLPGVTDAAKKLQAELCLNQRHELLAYKARPLNGIWATAPYLHNGSVPTLYDLLLPARLRNQATVGIVLPEPRGPVRPEVFAVGLREFDPVKVGFVSAPDTPEAPFIFRARNAVTGEPIPGNYNSGHNYGTTLSDEERFELVEYLKTL